MIDQGVLRLQFLEDWMGGEGRRGYGMPSLMKRWGIRRGSSCGQKDFDDSLREFGLNGEVWM